MLAARELRASAQPAHVVRPLERQQSSVRRRSKPAAVRVSRVACVCLVLAAVLWGFALTHRQGTLVRLGYQAEQLSAQLALLQRQNGERAVNLSRLGALGRVQSLAESRMGMLRPKGAVVVSTSVLPDVAGAANAVVVHPAAEAQALAYGEAATPGDEASALGRLWRALLRLARNTVEAAGRAI